MERRYSAYTVRNYRQAFEDFKASSKADYDALDARCQQLTRSERLIGHFET